MTLFCASITGLAAFFFHSPAALGVWLLCIITVVWNLNPFIRMDGYWILSDILGIDNLMAYNREVSKWVWQALRGSASQDTPFVFLRTYRYRNLYVPYYGLFIMFFAWMAFQMLFRFYPHLFRTERALWLKLWAHASPGAFAASVSTTGLQLILGLIPLVWILRRLLRTMPHVFRKLSTSPRKDAAVVDGASRNMRKDRVLAG